jgi:hypothetical protein
VGDAIAVGVKEITSPGGLFPAISPRSWARYDTTGKCPAGFRVAGRKLWRVADLQEWADMGFPSREAFEAQRAAG